jgi:hypothetical protein
MIYDIVLKFKDDGEEKRRLIKENSHSHGIFSAKLG